MIQVEIQDEHGVRIGSEVNFPPGMLPAETDSRFVCLRFVDPYGDTVFNCLQAPYLEADLQLLSSERVTPEQKTLLQDVLSLVAASRAEPHLYIKFIGD
jgi:hypothetical protein